MNPLKINTLQLLVWFFCLNLIVSGQSQDMEQVKQQPSQPTVIPQLSTVPNATDEAGNLFFIQTNQSVLRWTDWQGDLKGSISNFPGTRVWIDSEGFLYGFEETTTNRISGWGSETISLAPGAHFFKLNRQGQLVQTVSNTNEISEPYRSLQQVQVSKNGDLFFHYSDYGYSNLITKVSSSGGTEWSREVGGYYTLLALSSLGTVYSVENNFSVTRITSDGNRTSLPSTNDLGAVIRLTTDEKDRAYLLCFNYGFPYGMNQFARLSPNGSWENLVLPSYWLQLTHDHLGTLFYPDFQKIQSYGSLHGNFWYGTDQYAVSVKSIEFNRASLNWEHVITTNHLVHYMDDLSAPTRFVPTPTGEEYPFSVYSLSWHENYLVLSNKVFQMSATWETPLRHHVLMALNWGGFVTNAFNSSAYVPGARVRFKAVPNPGWNFLRWANYFNESSPEMEVEFNNTITLDPIFSTDVQTAVTEGSGEIRLIPDSQLYPEGSEVRAYAIPAPGFRVKGWNDIFHPSPALGVFVTQPHQRITVQFEPTSANESTLTAAVKGPGTILIANTTNWVPVNQAGNLVFTNGTEIQLKAEPEPGSVFAGWPGLTNTVGQNLSLIITSNTVVTALFLEQPNLLTDKGHFQLKTETEQVFDLQISSDLIHWETLSSHTNSGDFFWAPPYEQPAEFFRLRLKGDSAAR
jgi:hypothetical protein